MSTKTTRFEFRIDPESKSEIERAAAACGESASDFVTNAALERARAVLENQHVTAVPPDYFDRLIRALDEPIQRNEPTRRAIRRLDEVVKRS
jgi:uncharacterized protein (DUF1778 family)